MNNSKNKMTDKYDKKRIFKPDIGKSLSLVYLIKVVFSRHLSLLRLVKLKWNDRLLLSNSNK